VNKAKLAEEIPDLLPRPTHENELKRLEKAVRLKSKSKEKEKTPKYKELERIYL
jgi:hypothetical protein